MPSRSIHVVANIIIHCIYVYCIFFIHSSFDEHLLAYLIEHGVLISLRNTDFYSFIYTPRCGIAESYSSLIFNFWRNHHIVFIIAIPKFIFLPICPFSQHIPFSQHTQQHLLSLVCVIKTVLTGVKCYLIVDLIFISLIEYLFIELLTFCMSLENVCLGPLPIY